MCVCFSCQLLISKLEKKNLGTAEKELIVKVRHRLIFVFLLIVTFS